MTGAWSLGTEVWIHTPLGTLSNLAVMSPRPEGGVLARRFEATWEISPPARAAVLAFGDVVSGGQVLDSLLRHSGHGVGSGPWMSRYMMLVPDLPSSGSATETL